MLRVAKTLAQRIALAIGNNRTLPLLVLFVVGFAFAFTLGLGAEPEVVFGIVVLGVVAAIMESHSTTRN